MKKLITIMTLCFFYSSLFADELSKALSAFDSGHYESAINLLNELAITGNAEAQYHLAFMYLNGEGVKTDESKAFTLMREAAKKGYARAQDSLGHLYLNGRGVAPNPSEAYAWYSLAAKNGVFLADYIVNMLEIELKMEHVIKGKTLAKEYRTSMQN